MKTAPEVLLSLDPVARARLVAALVALLSEERREARRLDAVRRPQ